MGVTNVFGSAPGFISPQIVGIVTPNKTAGEWRIVFWITAIVYIIGIVIFGLLVSGDLQPWADTSKDDKDADNQGEDEEKVNEEQDEEKKDDQNPEENDEQEKKDDAEEKPSG
ncbi:vesicular glutamate transporter 2.2-like [Montipora foliosa]|uniref:vesicular glutamate transporter 2.2-like n=1 Tax=Montipora foliosa TaxID=591990 RepID=UPI0035F168A1